MLNLPGPDTAFDPAQEVKMAELKYKPSPAFPELTRKSLLEVKGAIRGFLYKIRCGRGMSDK